MIIISLHSDILSSSRTRAGLWTGLLLSILILLNPSESFSTEAPNPLEIAEKLQSTYEKAASLVADFSQTTSIQFSRRVRQGSGSLLFLKPGRMRWDYKQPDQQVLISDGQTISMYFAKSRQMVISNARDYLQSDVTYSFFAGTGNLMKDFEFSEPDLENPETLTHLIKMVPKSAHPHVSSIHAWVTKDTFLMTRLQIVDHFDTVTDLFFKNIRIDSTTYGGREISKDTFSFTPPAGTEIIKQ